MTWCTHELLPGIPRVIALFDELAGSLSGPIGPWFGLTGSEVLGRLVRRPAQRLKLSDVLEFDRSVILRLLDYEALSQAADLGIDYLPVKACGAG